MFERRNSAPLLSSKSRTGNGWPKLAAPARCNLTMAGILFGVALGMFITTSFLTRVRIDSTKSGETFQASSFLPPTSAALTGSTLPATDVLPSIREPSLNRQIQEETLSVTEARNKEEPVDETKAEKEAVIRNREIVNEAVKEATNKKEKKDEIEDLLHEGSRKLSENEKHGGWRFLPEVLKVSERYPNAQAQRPLSKYPSLKWILTFLSPDEVKHMLELAETHMTKSQVIGEKEGEQGNVRTSYGAWLTDESRDQKIIEIEERIHDAVGIPSPFGEGIYVLRYEQSQKYAPHTDNCAKESEIIHETCVQFTERASGPKCGEGFGGVSCGDRIATFIMYLRTPTKGGHTIFPNSAISKKNLKRSGRKSGDAVFGDMCLSPYYFKVQPDIGDAVLFWNFLPRDDIDNHATFVRSGSWDQKNKQTEACSDDTSLHGGCPVLEGEKWIATKWIRSTVFD